MTSNWKILAAVDLSRPAEEDVRYALWLAAATQADLHLLHVADSDGSDVVPPDWPANALADKIMGVRIHRTVLQGPVVRTIAEHADTIDANLVLLAVRRYGRWNRFGRKSVTEGVMRASRRPVGIVPEKAAGSGLRSENCRILCVVGLDGKETPLVRHAEAIAGRTGGDIALLHVVPQAGEAMLYHGIRSESRPLSRERATRDLTALSSTLGTPAITSVMVGDPDKCVRLAAHEHAADLVLVSRARVGSPAAYDSDLERIAGKLDCPLLTLPVDLRAVTPVIDATRAVATEPRRQSQAKAARAGLGQHTGGRVCVPHLVTAPRTS